MSVSASSVPRSQEDIASRMSITSILETMQEVNQEGATPTQKTRPTCMQRDLANKRTWCDACKEWLASAYVYNHMDTAKHEKNLEAYLSRQPCASSVTTATSTATTPTTTTAQMTATSKDSVPPSATWRKGKSVIWTKQDDEIILEGWFQLRNVKDIARQIGKAVGPTDQRRIALAKDDSEDSLYTTILKRYNPRAGRP